MCVCVCVIALCGFGCCGRCCRCCFRCGLLGHHWRIIGAGAARWMAPTGDGCRHDVIMWSPTAAARCSACSVCDSLYDSLYDSLCDSPYGSPYASPHPTRPPAARFGRFDIRRPLLKVAERTEGEPVAVASGVRSCLIKADDGNW